MFGIYVNRIYKYAYVYSTLYVHVCVCRIGAGNAAYGNILNALLPLLLAFRLVVVVVCANK